MRIYIIAPCLTKTLVASLGRKNLLIAEYGLLGCWNLIVDWLSGFRPFALWWQKDRLSRLQRLQGNLLRWFLNMQRKIRILLKNINPSILFWLLMIFDKVIGFYSNVVKKHSIIFVLNWQKNLKIYKKKKNSCNFSFFML